MPATYEPIATTTLGSAASTITFNSIGAGYTDLRLTLFCTPDSFGNNAFLRFNNDSGSNYSFTQLIGNGSTASSLRSTNQTSIQLTYPDTFSSLPVFIDIDIFSYAGSTNKTALFNVQADKNGSGSTTRNVALWRNTSAITRIDLFVGSTNFAIGTTATLYGILKA